MRTNWADHVTIKIDGVPIENIYTEWVAQKRKIAEFEEDKVRYCEALKNQGGVINKMADDKINIEKQIFKSLLIRLIHCTDGAKYEEDMVDDYWGLICDLCREYKEKYGEEVENEGI